MRRGALWAVMATCMGLTILAGGCRPDAGKPMLYSGTISNEIDIGAGTKHTYLDYQFGEAFQLPNGSINSTFQYNVSKAKIGGVPRSLTWSIEWYDAADSVQLGSYTLTAPLKMHPAGAGYGVAYKFKDTSFPGFNLGQNDHLRMSLTPTGGGLSAGDVYKIRYTYVPKL
jgi:hypothetical protein